MTASTRARLQCSRKTVLSIKASLRKKEPQQKLRLAKLYRDTDEVDLKAETEKRQEAQPVLPQYQIKMKSLTADDSETE